jgi:hypothetical protein
MESSGEREQVLEGEVPAGKEVSGRGVVYSNRIRFDLPVTVAVRHIDGGGNI